MVSRTLRSSVPNTFVPFAMPISTVATKMSIAI